MEKRRRRRRSLRVKEEGGRKKFGKGDDGLFVLNRAASLPGSKVTRAGNKSERSLHKSRAFVSARQKVKQIMAAAGDNAAHTQRACAKAFKRAEERNPRAERSFVTLTECRRHAPQPNTRRSEIVNNYCSPRAALF